MTDSKSITFNEMIGSLMGGPCSWHSTVAVWIDRLQGGLATGMK
jgi:hypothetical protein